MNAAVVFDFSKYMNAIVDVESTCVLVLEATTRLVPSPPKRTLVVLGYPDIPSGGDDAAWLLAEFGGQTHAEADAKAHKLFAAWKSGRARPPTRL